MVLEFLNATSWLSVCFMLCKTFNGIKSLFIDQTYIKNNNQNNQIINFKKS